MPRSLMLWMALDHAAQILRKFWVACSRVLHLAHTPPSRTGVIRLWDAARIEPFGGFKLRAFIITDSDLRHS